MWERSSSDTRRVIIVDVLHLAYKAAFGNMPVLTATINVGGTLTTFNTQIPTFIIKQLHRWSKGGVNPIVACFDGKGSNRCRNAYFASKRGLIKADSGDSNGGYKSGRKTQNDEFYSSVNTTMRLLHQAGVCVLCAENYEADDLIKATVDKAKLQYPDLPIDIITGDTDIAPLVDEQVSVFLASRKMTWAESDDIKKPHYYQLRPYNFQEYVEGLTNYKNLSVPYNTLLLTKLLRGDKSDSIDGYPKFTPTKYRNLIQSMIDDGVDMASICRYDSPISVYHYRATGERVPDNLISTTPREDMSVEYLDPPCLTKLIEVLSNYLDEDVCRHVRDVYNGINLNGVFREGLPETFWRQPANLTIDVKGYNKGLLQQILSPLRINLPMV